MKRVNPKRSFLQNESLEKLQTLTILYAEDEAGIRKNIADALHYYVKEVYEAENGLEAFEIYQQKSPDIILSDIHMPLLDGIGFVRKVRNKNRDIPVVMITAHTDKQYLFDAIDLHMEKYIVKPIELDPLLEILEQCADIIDSSRIKTLEVDTRYSYDYGKKELTYDHKSIILNKKEIRFLEVLISHQERVVTYVELQDTVWINDVMTDSALRSLVRNLRKKLPTDIVSNLSGVGYRLV